MVQYGAIRYWYKMLVTGKMQDMLIGPLQFAVLSPQRWYNMVWVQAQYVEGTIRIHHVTLWCVGTNYVAHHGITLI